MRPTFLRFWSFVHSFHVGRVVRLRKEEKRQGMMISGFVTPIPSSGFRDHHHHHVVSLSLFLDFSSSYRYYLPTYLHAVLHPNKSSKVDFLLLLLLSSPSSSSSSVVLRLIYLSS
mmetsp:Transcript_24991/g.59410  ORF Transcript_24991/g.59410 Transcript_24991/m.59410 type:complete len:115 (+) Transcript_24991:249-593(+)